MRQNEPEAASACYATIIFGSVRESITIIFGSVRESITIIFGSVRESITIILRGNSQIKCLNNIFLMNMRSWMLQ